MRKLVRKKLTPFKKDCTQLYCGPAKEAEMMTALAICLLNFIKLVVQIENESSVSEVLLPDFFPSDFLLGINYFAIPVNSLAYQ